MEKIGEDSGAITIRHPLQSRITFALSAAACWALAGAILFGNLAADKALAGPLALAALGLTFAFLSAQRTMCRLNAVELRHYTWRGIGIYRRSDLTGMESIVARRSAKKDGLLRFQNGVVFLSTARDCHDPERIMDFIEREWGFTRSDLQRAPVGPAAVDLYLYHEPRGVFLAALTTVALPLIGLAHPSLWVTFVLACLSARLLYRSMHRISTNESGITIHPPFGTDSKLPWEAIQSVRYWHSVTHGGVIVSDGKNKARVCRWAIGYPQFNRLLHDRLPASIFAPPATIPCTVSMNQRQWALWIPVSVLAGASAWFLLEGPWTHAAIAVSVALGFVAHGMFTSRHLEIDSEEIRDIRRTGLQKQTTVYPRRGLHDMRVGRQWTAGGLWLGFAGVKLEIGNRDSSVAPEELLALLNSVWTDTPAQPHAAPTTSVETLGISPPMVTQPR